jgi:hypothetical protein
VSTLRNFENLLISSIISFKLSEVQILTAAKIGTFGFGARDFFNRSPTFPRNEKVSEHRRDRMRKLSTHASAGGATVAAGGVVGPHVVSIHAPAGERPTRWLGL